MDSPVQVEILPSGNYKEAIPSIYVEGYSSVMCYESVQALGTYQCYSIVMK